MILDELVAQRPRGTLLLVDHVRSHGEQPLCGCGAEIRRADLPKRGQVHKGHLEHALVLVEKCSVVLAPYCYVASTMEDRRHDTLEEGIILLQDLTFYNIELAS